MEIVNRSSEAGPLGRYGTAALVTAGLGGAWVLGRGALPFDLACPMLASTGIPCPFCGMTRLGDRVLDGHVVDAVTSDPGGVALLAVIAILALVGVASRLGWRPRTMVSAGAVAVTAALALAVHWATTLTGGGFISA